MKKIILTLFTLGTMALVFSGCLGTHPGSSSLAYVTIEGSSMDLVRENTHRIFEDEYYKIIQETTAGIVYERDANMQDKARWGRYGEEGIVMRVVVKFESLKRDEILIRADAYVMKRRGEKVETITWVGRKPYQDMLRDIRANSISATPEQ